jgi:SAM-dependent methyltransferase
MSDDIKQIVKDKYGKIARAGGLGCCGGGSACCDPLTGGGFADSYEQLDGYVPEADLGLGCGLPTQDALIRPGDTVLDLGSGAGNDVFVARALVGPTGSVIGVDMVPDMVAKAKQNAAKLGAQNVTFHLGDIERLPLPDDHVDVVISNCVLNLVPDKRRAFAEIFRVLKPGGHFSVSDIVLEGELPGAMLEAAALYVGCVAGALQQQEYLDIIAAAGFAGVEVRRRRRIDLPDELLKQTVPAAAVEAFRSSGAGVWSLSVFGRRPETTKGQG